MYDDLWILTKDIEDLAEGTMSLAKGTVVRHLYDEAEMPLLETLDEEHSFYSATDEAKPLYLHLARKLAEVEEYETVDLSGPVVDGRMCDVCREVTTLGTATPHKNGCPFHILAQLADYLGDFVNRCAYCGEPAHYYAGGTHICGKPRCFVALVDALEAAPHGEQNGIDRSWTG
jgi:hypothetical protein